MEEVQAKERVESNLPAAIIEDLTKDIVFEIIGSGNEFINFIFFPLKSIIINQEAIKYLNGALVYSEQKIPNEKIVKSFSQSLIMKPTFLRCINNSKNKVAYIGASISSGIPYS